MYTRWRMKRYRRQPGGHRPQRLRRCLPLLPTAIAVLSLSSILVFSSQLTMAQEQQISSAARQQMRDLLNEKVARSAVQRKISSRLLVGALRRRGSDMMARVPELRTDVEVRQDNTTLVDMSAIVSEELLEQIKTSGGTVLNSSQRYQAIRAWVPLDQVETLAASRYVRSIRPADQLQIHKINTSEGGRAHKADVARAMFGIDGTGVKIGVLSDSVDALASLQSSGDLPTVTVLLGQSGNPGSSEGTAMLEIVHDLAPGAELFFATAFGGIAQFAQNILDLRAAGCDIVVDDVGYFAEPVFQDGIIAQAVNSVIADGAQYYSSAGNSGNKNDGTSGVWEGDYVAMPAPVAIATPGDAHNFGGGMSGNRITADSPSVFTLQWSDPQGGSGNDYDLFLLSSDLSTVLDSSTDTQDGDDNPFEQISSQGFNDTNNVLVIVRNAGAPNRFLHLNANRGRLAISTPGQTGGHSAAVKAFSVAAVNVATAVAGVFTGGSPNPVESFSSDGPRRVFYRANGAPITPGNFSSTGGAVRQKPDITAADGVSTATPGFAPFFGTSAAAPHAAAIGALLLDRHSALTPDAVRTIYNNTALDIEAPGTDRDSGVGIIMADAALAAAGGPILPVALSVSKTAGSSANLVYTITVNNAGPGNAQDVVVTENLPSNVTFVSTSGCAEDNNGVPTCTLGSIPAGGSKQYTITAAITATSAGLLDNTPTVRSSTPSPNALPGSQPQAGGVSITTSQSSMQSVKTGQEVSIDINIRVPMK